MKMTKLLSPLAMMILIGLTASGCVRGPKGDPGVPGDPGVNGQSTGGGIATSIDCKEVVTDSPGNEVHVEYSTVFTKNGDRYSTATLKLDGYQSSATVFHAASNSAVRFGQVNILEDWYGTGLNYGTWYINYDRQQQKLNIIHDDPDNAGPYIHPVSASPCIIKNW